MQQVYLLQLTPVWVRLKGQCHKIFCFRFFSWITFPQAPENDIRVISNFLENSRRYSQVKVHHRCRWHRWQIATGINDTGGKFATSINDTGGKFCHHFRLCCWHWWQICRRCQRCRWQIATGINEHRRQICHRCRWHRWQIMGTISAADTLKWTWRQKFIYMLNLLPKGAQTKFEMAVMVYSHAWGKLIHEKKQKSKISWPCPFNNVSGLILSVTTNKRRSIF